MPRILIVDDSRLIQGMISGASDTVIEAITGEDKWAGLPIISGSPCR